MSGVIIKKEHLTVSFTGKRAFYHILISGGAPGDHWAAESNGWRLFHRINPRDGEKSWRRLHGEVLPCFPAKNYIAMQFTRID